MVEIEKANVDIFTPQQYYETLPAFVFGLCESINKNDHLINCTISGSFEIAGGLSTFSNVAQSFNEKSAHQNIKACLGIIYHQSDYGFVHSQNLKDLGCPIFLIEISDLKKTTFINWTGSNDNDLFPSATIITYDSQHLYTSELLETSLKMSFVDFLFKTLAIRKTDIDVLLPSVHGNFLYCEKPCSILQSKTKLIHILVAILTLICSACDYLIQRTPKAFQKCISLTSTGNQMRCKYYHLKSILQDLVKNEKVTLLSGNLLSALLLDAICGLLISCCFKEHLQPVTLVDAVIDRTDMLVTRLQQLIFWLMGIPAGLKLNLPLNSVLGRFFLYHIYLWKTYIVLIKPFLVVVLEFSMNFGALGFSLLISLGTDFISLATLHIYCFYGYAARIYSLKIAGLIALWRLFRGKKWNPLRKRVDSYTYDVQQLFLGTLIFTVIIFLLPTVALYYAVFSMLRLLVLLLQFVLWKIIDTLSTFPVYTLLLHFTGHPLVKGDLHLRIVSSTEGTLSLSLEVISISLREVVKKSLPLHRLTVRVGLKELVNSLLFGNVIHPL